MVQESLPCLRLIACTPATPRLLTDQQRQAAYTALECARADIFSAWQFATDPANLQPKIRPLLRRAAEVVRKYPPPGTSQEELDAAVESLEASWGARIENAIRQALDDASDREASMRVLEEVKRPGLQKYQAPEPLPPIQQDEVHLVWMALRPYRESVYY